MIPHLIRSFDDYQQAYKSASQDPEKFWAEIARSFHWHSPFSKVLEWDFTRAHTQWFLEGKLNLSYNCLDRHLPAHKNTIAYHWEPNEPGEPTLTLTYEELLTEVCRLGDALKTLGVSKGDRVIIYLPMIPQLAIAVLACARIGAVHSVVFGGFSSHALAGRIQDCDARVVITSDGAYRGNKKIPMKATVDQALEVCPGVEKVVVVRRTAEEVSFTHNRDYWYHEITAGASRFIEPEWMDSEDPLFILYTSGSTGKPKGVVHSCGGYMVFTSYTFLNVFQYQPGEVFWCTADIGWITGHSYIVYGPLLSAAESVMFEGVPNYPDFDRFWQVIEKYQVNIFYTAPTAIRALEAAGNEFVEPYSMSSLRVLGSVGEPINVEAWEWYHRYVGKGRCPIVDTWWQTETGGIMISPLAGITPLKPGFATLPLPGIFPALVNDKGELIEGNPAEGNLVIVYPWPSVIRTTYGDHERFRQNYFAAYPGMYFTGDGCRRDEDGFYRITGRVDDVINVSGHRIGTAEVESAINMHADVVESAVVGFPHDIKGQGIYAYVICTNHEKSYESLVKEIHAEVNHLIGPIAKPDKIQVVKGLPKTRSGKIMRRILRKIAADDTGNMGDTSTLLDPGVVEEIIKGKV
jgi:acetyl-CoA synthetase